MGFEQPSFSPRKEQRRILPRESTPGDSHIADYGDKKVDVYKLIHAAESLPVETVNMLELEDCRENNYWFDKNGAWLGPHHIADAVMKMGKTDFDALVEQHPAWEDEIRKIQHADYESYPILIVGNTVVDGLHRYTKALVDGQKTINAKRFPELPQETIARGL